MSSPRTTVTSVTNAYTPDRWTTSSNSRKAQVKSLKQLAFASSYTPGMADETPLMNVLQSMVGAGASLSIAQKACFRAVYHEAYAIVTSETRHKSKGLRSRQSGISASPSMPNAFRSSWLGSQASPSRVSASLLKRWLMSVSGCTRAMPLSMWSGRSVHRESRSCLVTPRRT